jgi:multidrug efflux system membrane fusion protein
MAGCGKTETANANSKGGPGGAGGRRGGGDVPVTIAKAVQKEVPVDLQVIGNIEAYLTINVKAQVGGELTRVFFHEGDFVKAGETLFTIDRRQLEAQLQQAQATLMKNEAQLQQAQANLARDQAQSEYSKSQAGRYAQLTKEGVISKEQNDQAQTSADAANKTVDADRANIESAKADIAATKASIDNIRVMLSYTTIKSPITGRTGNLNVKQGNVVAANTTDLMTINQIQPIYATFSVPEVHLPAIKSGLQSKLLVFAAPQDASEPPHQGVLSFIDNTVDPTTGTIRCKATFPNEDRKMWPGEFVRVTIRLRTDPNAVVVPSQAVQTGQSGPYIYVVKEDRSVETRDVVAGARVDQDQVISKGIAPGETVVVEGQLRLAPGMKVQIRDNSGTGGGGRRAGRGGQSGGQGGPGGAPAGGQNRAGNPGSGSADNPGTPAGQPGGPRSGFRRNGEGGGRPAQQPPQQ